MFGNKAHKNNDSSNENFTSIDNSAQNTANTARWSIVSGYISSAISAGQDDYGAPVVNFKVIIPLKHPTPIHYEYYAIAGGRRIPRIQTEMIDHWDYQCTKYSQDPVAEVKKIQNHKGSFVEVTGHRVDGTFKLKKNGFSIQTMSHVRENKTNRRENTNK